jgi:hypothetical protein
MHTVQSLVQQFNMLPHPEGGYYKETYRSLETIQHEALPIRFGGNRYFSTAIYFLLEQGNFSAFHKIKSDECWHFYAGQSLLVYVLQPNGNLSIIRVGNNLEAGDTFQYVVPANCWFASEPAPESDFSFVGCTVAPSFDFADFELVKASNLIKEFPQYSNIIKRLCRQ